MTTERWSPPSQTAYDHLGVQLLRVSPGVPIPMGPTEFVVATLDEETMVLGRLYVNDGRPRRTDSPHWQFVAMCQEWVNGPKWPERNTGFTTVAYDAEEALTELIEAVS